MVVFRAQSFDKVQWRSLFIGRHEGSLQSKNIGSDLNQQKSIGLGTFLINWAVEVVLVELMRRWWSQDSLRGVIKGVRSVRRSSSGMGDCEGRRDRMVEREISALSPIFRQILFVVRTGNGTGPFHKCT